MSNLKFSILETLVSPAKAIKVIFKDSHLMTLLFTALHAQHTVLNSLFGKSTLVTVLIFAFEKFQDEGSEGKFVAFLCTQLTKSQRDKLTGANIIEAIVNVSKKGKFNIYTGEKLGETKVEIDSDFIQIAKDAQKYKTYAKYLESLKPKADTETTANVEETPQAAA